MTQLSNLRNGEVIAFMDESAADDYNDPDQAEPLNDRSTKDQIKKDSLSLVYYDRPQHLIETDNTNNPKPTYGPEIDDLEPEGKHVGGSNDDDDKGIDDGLLEKPIPNPPPSAPNYPGRGYPPFPADGYPVPPIVIPDVNVYQQKKILAQGMMDLALVSANASQFRYVLQSNSRHPFYYPSLMMIGSSLFLQIVVGIGLIWNSRYNVKNDNEMCKANRTNNWTLIGIFLITIINVFISSFGIVDVQERTFYNPSTFG